MLEFRLISSYTHFELLAPKMSAVVFAPDAISLTRGYSQLFRNFNSYGRISYAFTLRSLRKMLWDSHAKLPQLVIMEVNKNLAERKLKEISFGLMAIGARELGEQPLRITGEMHREAEIPVIIVADMPPKQCEYLLACVVPSSRLMPEAITIVEKNKFFGQRYDVLPGTNILDSISTLYQRKRTTYTFEMPHNSIQ